MTKRYEIYKDSGVQWLGEIPGHWKRTRLKNVMKLLNGRAYLQPELQEEGKYRILRVGNFFTNDKWYYSDMELEPTKYCEKGDLLFAWSASFGPYIWDEEKVIYHYHIWKVLLGEKYDKYYAYFMFKAFSEVKRRDVHGSTMVHLTLQDMNQSYIPLPPLSEQHSIVSYLDDKCAKIDKSIETMEKQIALLREMKQRVIADAVTRGLDKTVKMKKSGIAWLDEVPEHWGEKKMKYLFTERSEKNHPNEPMLSATQNEGVILQSKYKGRIVEVNTGFEGLKLVKVGDFVIHLRSFQGGIEYTYDQGIISSAYTILTPNNENESPYYKYLFKSHSYIQLLKTCVTGIREGQNINYSKLKQHFIPLPPLSEQRAIVSYLNERTTKIETLAKKIEQEIVYLKEYKQRLISDVVTGQVKVC